MKASTIYPSRFLLMAICEKPEILTKDQRDAAGICARQILEFAQTQVPRDNGLVRSGIEAVCRTFESDSGRAEALLRKFLPEEHLKLYGYVDMPVLSREAGRLISHAPALVRDMYIAAFGFEESQDEQTSMGPGRIMPLTSNRRQDYQMSHWQFGKIFPAFLRQSPDHAIEALVAVVSAEIGTKRARNGTELPEETFDFQGSVARLKSDMSHIWDATHYRHEAHLTMLDALEAELVRLGADPSLHAPFQRLLSAVAKTNNYAAVWRKVLASGIRNTKVIGKQLADLAASIPILTCADTSHLAGEFIKAAYSELDTVPREKIERAILAIPAICPNDRVEIANRIRNQLLGCIPAELISTQEARAIVKDLTQKGGVPPNEPPFQIHSSFGGPYTDEQFLADQGVPVNETPNRKLLDLIAPLRKFVADHSNTAPGAAEIEGVVTDAQRLYEALLSAEKSGAHQRQIDNAWTHLVALCACVARCDQLGGDSESGRFVKKVLLEGAKHKNPDSNQRWDDQFDDHASWSPAPRIDAAEGLLFLATKPAFIAPDLLSAIEMLSVDPVPAVRLQIANYLGTLAQTAPQQMNKILRAILANDASSSVVLGALSRQLWQMMQQKPAETEELALAVFVRNDLKGKVAKEVRSWCVSIFLNLHLWKDRATSGAKIREFCSAVDLYLADAAGIVSHLREILVLGAIEPPEPACETARMRAFQLLETIISSTQSAFEKFQEAHKGVIFSDLPKEDQELARGLVELLDSISSQLYFASGAFDEKPNVNDPTKHVLSIREKQRFLKEAGKALDLLGTSPHPSIVHHLIETLHGLLEAGPKEVFLRMVRIVKVGKAGGYQYESLAIGEIVTIVNRVFADFRPILQEDQSVRLAMVEMLDVFVEAGWPQAIQLTYRLDEVFR